MMRYRRVFTHPEIGRLQGKLYAPEDLEYLRSYGRLVAKGECLCLHFMCADGRELFLSKEQLAAGLLWIEPAGEGGSPADEAPPVKQFREAPGEMTG